MKKLCKSDFFYLEGPKEAQQYEGVFPRDNYMQLWTGENVLFKLPRNKHTLWADVFF